MTKVTITAMGDSAMIRIPQDVMAELGLKPGDVVEISTRRSESIVLRKASVAFAAGELLTEAERPAWEAGPDAADWGADAGARRFYEYD